VPGIPGCFAAAPAVGNKFSYCESKRVPQIPVVTRNTKSESKSNGALIKFKRTCAHVGIPSARYVIRGHDPRSIIAYNAPHVASFRKLSRTIIRPVSNEIRISTLLFSKGTLWRISCRRSNLWAL